jgi:hypothetical protein
MAVEIHKHTNVDRPSEVEAPHGRSLAEASPSGITALSGGTNEFSRSDIVPSTDVSSPAQYRTELDRVVAEQFAHASSWSTDGGWRLFDSNSFGVEHDSSDFRVEPSAWRLTKPEKTWIANVYGVRIVPAPVTAEGNEVLLETVDLPELETMQRAFADTVLEGENARIAVLTEPVMPAQGDEYPPNNDRWLEVIRDGGWPVMRDHALGNGEFDYSPHDLGVHMGNTMLFPRELQDIIGEAAGHELAWRQEHPITYKTDDEDKVLLLPGETDFRAGGYSYTDKPETGIDKIDRITDVASYGDFLSYLVNNKEQSPQELADELRAVAVDPEYDPNADTLRGSGIRTVRYMPKVVADLANYNTRHREGRNATPEEIDAVVESFFTGAARVAEKIRGTYKAAA